MSTSITLVVDHGYAMLFGDVLVSQLGVPLPSGPVIMAAGALGAEGRIGVGTSVAIVVFASLCADSVWYLFGRTRGSRVVRILCRISLEPEACGSRGAPRSVAASGHGRRPGSPGDVGAPRCLPAL